MMAAVAVAGEEEGATVMVAASMAEALLIYLVVAKKNP